MPLSVSVAYKFDPKAFAPGDVTYFLIQATGRGASGVTILESTGVTRRLEQESKPRSAALEANVFSTKPARRPEDRI